MPRLPAKPASRPWRPCAARRRPCWCSISGCRTWKARRSSRMIRNEGIATSVIVITSNASLKVAVDAMRLGAFDYLVKPFSDERLVTTVRNALERATLQQEVKTFRALARKPQGDERVHRFVTTDAGRLPHHRKRRGYRAQRCSSPARAAPARKSAPMPSIRPATARPDRSWPSTAPPFRAT